jgi:hypothetical protein
MDQSSKVVGNDEVRVLDGGGDGLREMVVVGQGSLVANDGADDRNKQNIKSKLSTVT